jgi:hypothetical protein
LDPTVPKIAESGHRSFALFNDRGTGIDYSARRRFHPVHNVSIAARWIVDDQATGVSSAFRENLIPNVFADAHRAIT